MKKQNSNGGVLKIYHFAIVALIINYNLGCMSSASKRGSTQDQGLYYELDSKANKIVYLGLESSVPFSGGHICNYSENRIVVMNFKDGYLNGDKFMINSLSGDTIEKAQYILGNCVTKSKIIKGENRFTEVYSSHQGVINEQDQHTIGTQLRFLLDEDSINIDYEDRTSFPNEIVNQQAKLAMHVFQDLYGPFDTFNVVDKRIALFESSEKRLSYHIELYFKSGEATLQLSTDPNEKLQSFEILKVTGLNSLNEKQIELISHLNGMAPSPIWMKDSDANILKESIEYYGQEVGIEFDTSGVDLIYSFVDQLRISMRIRGEKKGIKDHANLVDYVFYFLLDGDNEIQYLNYKIIKQRNSFNCSEYLVYD